MMVTYYVFKTENKSKRCYQSMFLGLLAPERPFISFYKSVLSFEGAIISKSPIDSGISPNFLNFLYFSILAIAMRSSSGVIFFFPLILSLITSKSCSLSKSGGSTMSRISSIRDCLIT
jgi:hypothetical protein